jgi:hypothetical protein
MSTRIRYSSTSDHILRSTRGFTIGEVTHFVFLNLDALTFSIGDPVSGVVLAEGKGVSESNLKLKAKRALTSLGVSFDSESRAKRTASEEAVAS